MSQNTSHAVMSQRSEPHDSLDFFPTRFWATRALCEHLKRDCNLGGMPVWEPCCGQGHMSRPLSEYFREVHSSDVHDYGFGEVHDFLFPSDLRTSWVITNPPFRLAEQIITTALDRACHGVAMLVRTAFLESAGRYENLFRDHPPYEILQFCERVPMHRGRVEPKGSTATAYCWIVWRKGLGGTRFRWIAPCRARLERVSDYEYDLSGVAA